MAHIYVRSSDGSDADNGSTWALAKATGAGATAIESAGDQINFSSAHSESTAAGYTWTIAGSAANLTKLLSVNDAAEPPTALAAGAAVAVTNHAAQGTVNGNCYVYGISFNCGSGANTTFFAIASNNESQVQIYESCAFRLSNSSSGFSRFWIGRDGTTSGARIEWNNCTVKFGAAAQSMEIAGTLLEWTNGIGGGSAVGVEAGGTSPTALFITIGGTSGGGAGRAADVFMRGVDLSNCSAGLNICSALLTTSKLLLRNCKMPASWSGSLVSSNIELGAVATMVNCDGADTNYRFRQQTRAGVVDHETTLVMSGGASDGVTTFSHKVVTNTLCGPGSHWRSPPMFVEVTATGSAKTITVELLRDSATNLTDAEVWIEVEAPTNASYPLSTLTTDRVADVMTAEADQATSAASWTTTGMSNPNEQKCSVSVTPQEKGWYTVRLVVAKASTTLYYNPEPSVA